MTQKLFFSGLKLIPTPYRAKGLRLTLLMLAGSVFDFFSLASFLPLIVVIINPDITQSNPYLHSLYQFTGTENVAHFVIALTIAAFLLILLKTRFNLWTTLQKAKYSYEVASQIADQAMTTYLTRSYIDYSDTDYSREMNKISNLPIVYANNFLIPLGTFLTELIIVFTLLIAITLYHFDVFLFLILVSTPLVVIYRWQRKRIHQVSAQIKLTYPKLLKYTLQAIEGLTEIKVFNKEEYFKKRFNNTFKELGSTFSKDHLHFTSSIRMTEVVVTLCLCSLIIYTQLSGQSYQESVLLLSVYAGASFRAIPSVNRILSASVQIRTHEYAFQELEKMILPKNYQELLSEDKVTIHTLKHNISLESISFSYDGEKLILDQAHLDIKKGEKIIILGKSGAGKSTLLLILLRFLNQTGGTIKVDEIEIQSQNASLLSGLMGYVPQNPYILDGSIFENIAFGITEEKIDHQKINNILKQLDLKEWTDTLPLGSHTIIGEKGAKISGGQCQRIAIGRALYHDSQVLLLDEVTNQLDRTTEHEIIKLLDKLTPEKTIVLITHRTELSDYFDRVILLKNKGFKEVYKEEIQNIVYDE